MPESESLAEWFTRHLRGRSVAAVAAQLRTSRQTIYAYQKGVTKPTLPMLYAFCGVLMLSDAEKRAAVDMLAAL